VHCTGRGAPLKRGGPAREGHPEADRGARTSSLASYRANRAAAAAHSLSFRCKIRDVGPIKKFQQQQQQIDSNLPE
jgi:hypothetical protein